MTPADKKRLFGDSFTKARVLLRNGYYGHAAKLLVNQAVTAIEGS
jgi:hypothetical protein